MLGDVDGYIANKQIRYLNTFVHQTNQSFRFTVHSQLRQYIIEKQFPVCARLDFTYHKIALLENWRNGIVCYFVTSLENYFQIKYLRKNSLIIDHKIHLRLSITLCIYNVCWVLFINRARLKSVTYSWK